MCYIWQPRKCDNRDISLLLLNCIVLFTFLCSKFRIPIGPIDLYFGDSGVYLISCFDKFFIVLLLPLLLWWWQHVISQTFGHCKSIWLCKRIDPNSDCFFHLKKNFLLFLQKRWNFFFFFPDPSFDRMKRVLLGLFAFEKENLFESLQKNLISSSSSSNTVEMKLAFESYQKKKRNCWFWWEKSPAFSISADWAMSPFFEWLGNKSKK